LASLVRQPRIGFAPTPENGTVQLRSAMKKPRRGKAGLSHPWTCPARNHESAGHRVNARLLVRVPQPFSSEAVLRILGLQRLLGDISNGIPAAGPRDPTLDQPCAFAHGGGLGDRRPLFTRASTTPDAPMTAHPVEPAAVVGIEPHGHRGHLPHRRCDQCHYDRAHQEPPAERCCMSLSPPRLDGNLVAVAIATVIWIVLIGWIGDL